MARHEEAAAALEALAAAGIREICLTWQTDWVLDLKSEPAPIGAVLPRLPALLAEDAGAEERYLIFRAPSRDVVVFDDCNDDATARLQPFAFLVVRTSPGNCHVWLRLDRPEAARAPFRQMEPSGANGYSMNGGRLPGFVNRKRHRRGPDGGYPITQLV